MVKLKKEKLGKKQEELVKAPAETVETQVVVEEPPQAQSEAENVSVEAPTPAQTIGPHHVKILSKRSVVINGREYFDVTLGDMSVVRLSPKDFDSQVNK